MTEPPAPFRAATEQPPPKSAPTPVSKAGTKSAGAFRTIGELAAELGVAPHVLRYWETRFPQLKPLQRAGNRRYYRPEDATLARRIQDLLGVQGYTIKGVQALLARSEPPGAQEDGPASSVQQAFPPVPPEAEPKFGSVDRAAIVAIRDSLAQTLDQDSNET